MIDINDVLSDTQIFKRALFHGTSSVFIDSIIKNGLGSIDPIKGDLARFYSNCFSVCKQCISPCNNFTMCEKMLADIERQAIVGPFNMQHGSTYVSLCKPNAYNYSTSNFFGSEFLNYTWQLYSFLKECGASSCILLPDTVEKIFVQKNSYSNLLIKINRVDIRALASEYGGSAFDYLKDKLSTIHDISWLDQGLNINFRLLRPINSNDFDVFKIE